MAAHTLPTISWDEIERARLQSEYKFEMDLQSKMVDARRDGIAEGHAEGRKEGFAEGFAEGLAEVKLEMVKAMRTMGLSEEQIAQATGMPLEEIKAYLQGKPNDETQREDG